MGLPDIRSTGADLVCVEWQSYPSGAQNPQFLRELQSEGVTPGPGSRVYFLCRSGVRSVAAAEAATAAGYEAYNILEGFEGSLDAGSQRRVNGWKNRGLPWRQS